MPTWLAVTPRSSSRSSKVKVSPSPTRGLCSPTLPASFASSHTPRPAASSRNSELHRRAVGNVTARLNMPWYQLLDALEQTTPADVALVSIEPDGGSQVVRLVAEAKELDALLVYVKALQSEAFFRDVRPLKHETNEREPQRPVRLSIELRLRSPGSKT